MRKSPHLWWLCFLGMALLAACSPSARIRQDVSDALTQTREAWPTAATRLTLTVLAARTPAPTTSPKQQPAAGPSITPASDAYPSAVPTATSAGAVAQQATPTPSVTPASRAYPPPATSSPAPGLTPTNSPTATPTPSRTPQATPTGTITPGQSPVPTATPSHTPSATAAPTSSPTPTPSPTPTATPALPALSSLAIDTAALNAVLNIWQQSPENITDELYDLAEEICVVDCIALRWQSADFAQILVLTMYRTSDFPLAAQVAFSAQGIYLDENFQLMDIPAGNNLPDHAWMAEKAGREFVLFTSQGPAVISLFWQSDDTLDPLETAVTIAAYAGMQSDILRANGFITTQPQATPFPGFSVQ